MNAIKLKWKSMLALTGCLSLMACMGNSKVTGVVEGGNTTATVEGIVLDTQNKPVSNARVLLRRKDYLSTDLNTLQKSARKVLDRADPAVYTVIPINIANVVTDSMGYYQISNVDTGAYNLEMQKDSFARVQSFKIISDSLLNLGEKALAKTSSIKGVIKFAAVDTIVKAEVKVYGLERGVQVDSLTGNYIIEGVPSGVFDLRVDSKQANWSSFDIKNLEIKDDEEFEVEDQELEIEEEYEELEEEL